MDAADVRSRERHCVPVFDINLWRVFLVFVSFEDFTGFGYVRLMQIPCSHGM